jgi:serine/threonine-protein kinase PknK
VESRAMWLVEHSSMATLLALVGKIPADRVAGQARLQMAIAWANTLLHLAAEAQGRPRPGPSRDALRCDIER